MAVKQVRSSRTVMSKQVFPKRPPCAHRQFRVSAKPRLNYASSPQVQPFLFSNNMCVLDHNVLCSNQLNALCKQSTLE